MLTKMKTSSRSLLLIFFQENKKERAKYEKDTHTALIQRFSFVQSNWFFFPTKEKLKQSLCRIKVTFFFLWMTCQPFLSWQKKNEAIEDRNWWYFFCGFFLWNLFEPPRQNKLHSFWDFFYHLHQTDMLKQK